MKIFHQKLCLHLSWNQIFECSKSLQSILSPFSLSSFAVFFMFSTTMGSFKSTQSSPDRITNILSSNNLFCYKHLHLNTNEIHSYKLLFMVGSIWFYTIWLWSPQVHQRNQCLSSKNNQRRRQRSFQLKLVAMDASLASLSEQVTSLMTHSKSSCEA